MTFHLVLPWPCVWLFLFLHNFYKEQPLFYSSSEQNPFFVFMIEFPSELLCSIFISCRLGQYHLGFKSWAAAVRTSIFFQILGNTVPQMKECVKNLWEGNKIFFKRDWLEVVTIIKTKYPQKCKTAVNSASNYWIFIFSHLYFICSMN